MGQMTQIGNTNKNDPQMQDIKSLLQDMKIAQNEQQAEAMLNDPQQSESIYQFIEQRGGVNEVKRAYRQESTRPSRQPMKQSAPPVGYYTRNSLTYTTKLTVLNCDIFGRNFDQKLFCIKIASNFWQTISQKFWVKSLSKMDFTETLITA